MRGLLLVTVLAFTALALPAAADEHDPTAGILPEAPRAWLTIGPVDHRARRPFNPDAVFARYLLDPTAPPPQAGDTLIGERQQEQAWKVQQADEQGQIGGRIAYAYATVDSPKDQIVMAWLKSGGTLFVNGTPHVGAIYGDRFEVPIQLRKGINHLFVKGVRGAFELTFSAPPAGIFLAPFRQTKPDLIAGEAVDTVAGLLLVNARERPLGQLLWTFAGNEWLEPSRSQGALPIAPLGLVQVRIPLKTRPGKTAPAEPGKVDVPIQVRGAYAGPAHDAVLTLEVRAREKAVIRTFVSQIDDSVQRFGMREPLTGGPEKKGLVLSLHGAGVNPRGQATAYSRKSDFWLFAPTNRDRFGFDWQDWGRLDAYEVLAEGLRISGVDRSRVYLTGHSMGGHGTWHLGANDPDGFAAIAPSAGWISFDTYPAPRRKGELTHIWHAADGASRTRELVDNLKQLPTFILHGEKDDNVPVEQAREMEKLLTAAGAKPGVHYEPDKKHWWDGYPEPGAQCVDWPGIYDLFRRTSIARAPRHLRFRTVDPSVDARHHWVEVRHPLRYGEPCDVIASWDSQQRSLILQTKNVATLRLGPGVVPLLLNGRRVRFAPRAQGIELRRTKEGQPWSENRIAGPGEKSPTAGGPFKRSFTNRFVLVHGTGGNDEMDQALLEQARFDGQRWMYRANGQALILSDRQWEHANRLRGVEGRNAILYGHRFSNSVQRTLDTAVRPFPVRAAQVGVRLGSRDLPGRDQAACAVLPGPHDGTLLGLVVSTSVRASRLGFTTMLFISGAGWPDYTIFDEGILTRGDGGVRAAGWFGRAWQVQPGGYLRELREGIKPK